MQSRDDLELAKGWLGAARDQGIAGELEAIYAMIADAVEARGPACWASGRCCNFQKTGHLLYVTGLEAAYTVSRAPAALTPGVVEGATASGTCPYQERNLCGAHPMRPLGCRVYFCDRSAQDWQRSLSERMLEQVRRLHDRRGIAYRYGEWRAMLGLVLAGA